MKPDDIPYTPWSPIEKDEMFWNQGVVIQQIMRILQRPPNQRCSCAIVGGPGMGKTSILKHVRRTLLKDRRLTSASGKPRLVPVYVEMKDGLGTMSNPLRTLFCHIAAAVKIETGQWIAERIDSPLKPRRHSHPKETSAPTSDSEDRASFSADLWSVVKDMERRVGNVRLVILLDDLNKISGYPDLCASLAESLFALLRPALDERDMRPYVTFVLACTRDLPEQLPVKSTDPLINVMEQISLRSFGKEASLQLINHPLEEHFCTTLVTDIADEIYNYMGGHPRLLQLFMFSLCEHYDDLGTIEHAQIQEEALSTAIENMGLATQILQFIQVKPGVQPVFDTLRGHIGPMGFQEIATTLLPTYPNMKFQLDSALRTLESLGVVVVEGTAHLRRFSIGGEVFKNWFMVLSDWAITEDQPLEDMINILETKLRRLLEDPSVRDNQQMSSALQDKLVTLRTNKCLVTELRALNPQLMNPIHNDSLKVCVQNVQGIATWLEFHRGP